MATLLRLSLFIFIFSVSVQAESTDKNNRQLAVNCLQCHADPSTKAPLIGDSDHWSSILEQGKEVVLKHVYLGLNGMPPLGYCSSCSQQDFINLIKLMAGPIAAAGFDIKKEESIHAK